MRFARSEIVSRLSTSIADGRPVIAAGAGIGLSAKFTEGGGTDPIASPDLDLTQAAGLER
jgi:predicted TIM-barrel enzyme